MAEPIGESQDLLALGPTAADMLFLHCKLCGGCLQVSDLTGIQSSLLLRNASESSSALYPGSSRLAWGPVGRTGIGRP